MADVVVYSSSTCPYCTQVKDLLKKYDVEYEEKNISADADARAELMQKGHMGVPVTIIDGEEIVGYDASKIKSALGL